jgi:hypothetical protein
MPAIKIVDFETGLKARALWTLADEYFKKGQEFEQLLGDTLGVLDGPGSSYCGHFSDAFYGSGTFDEALKKSDMSIAPRKAKKKR